MMRTLRVVTVLALVSIAACARQPRPTAPRPITLASVYGDSTLAKVSSAPRPREWSDDVVVQAPADAHVAIFEFSRRGKPQLRITRGGEARVVSSLHWRTKGYTSGGKAPGFYGDARGQTVCTPGWVQTGQGFQGYTTPSVCTEARSRPSYSPSYSQSRSVEYRAVLVVVADSALRLSERDRLLRRFAQSGGSVHALSTLAGDIAPRGRWAAVIHSPLRVQ
jgi:hypothetical protein